MTSLPIESIVTQEQYIGGYPYPSGIVEAGEAFQLTLVDLLISIGSAGLVLFTLPTVLNKNSQVPRKAASIPTALILTYFVPLFASSGLVLTSLTIAGQAIVWWLIVAFRPVRSRDRDRIEQGARPTLPRAQPDIP